MAFLLFLGAGSSKPFDIPTMKEMVVEYEKQLEKTDKEGFNFYSGIKQLLIEGFGFTRVDIELILSVIQGIANDVTPQRISPFAYYYISKSKIKTEFSGEEKHLAKKLVEDLKKYIRDVCTSKQEKSKITNAYNRSYHAFFSQIGGTKTNFASDHAYTMEWRAYTTNYDRIFENFWDNFRKVTDYFDSQGESAHSVFNPSKNVKEGGFVKLHGSLDWERDKSDQVMKIVPTGYTIYEPQGEVMLYPIQQKDLYLHPWITLFQNLKDGLHNCNYWIAIGYSFNDEFIFSVFDEAFRSDKILLIIDPDARQIRSKFSKELHTRIIPLPIKFGDENFSQQFDDYNKGIKTLKFTIRPSSTNIIGFESSSEIRNVELIVEGKIMLVGIQRDGKNHWVQIQANNPENKLLQFIVKIKYEPPFDKDFDMKITSNGIFNIDYSMSVCNRIIRTSTIQTKNPQSGCYASDPIKINERELMIL